MFSNLIFILVVILIISLGPEVGSAELISDPLTALLYGYGAFLGVLILIALPCKIFPKFVRRRKILWLTITNIELISLLCFLHFVLGIDRFFYMSPLPGFLNALNSLLLYFIGIGFFHFLTYTPKQNSLNPNVHGRGSSIGREIRLWIPFILPLLFFTLVVDLGVFFPDEWWRRLGVVDNESFTIFVVVGTLLFFLMPMMIFMP